MTYKVGRDLSQPSHRLTGRHRTQADSLDIRRILTCGYGFWRTANAKTSVANTLACSDSPTAENDSVLMSPPDTPLP